MSGTTPLAKRIEPQVSSNALEALATRAGAWFSEVRAKVLESSRVRHLTEIPAAVRLLFPTAHEISAEQHIRIQASFQAHVDNAVSKTINFLADATVSQMTDAYRRAFALGCKGVTVYRHGAKAGQVLTPVAASSVCPDVRCPACGTHIDGVDMDGASVLRKP